MKRLRLGVVGTGFGRYGIVPAFRRDSRVEIVSIASGTPGRAASISQELSIPEYYDGWEGLLAQKNIDAVAIALPPLLQEIVAHHALDRGLPVFAEKPLAASIESAERLARMAASKNVANVVDFIFPEFRTWRQAKVLLDSGAIGSLRHVFLDWRMESYDIRERVSGWKTDSREGGGCLQHFGSHSLYYLEWLFGPILWVSGNKLTAGELSGRGDTLSVLSLEFRSGLTAAVVISSGATCSSLHRLEVSASNGSLVLCNDRADPVLGFGLQVTLRDGSTPFQAHREGDGIQLDGDSRVQPVSRLAKRFTDWVLDGTATRPSFSDGLRVQRLLDAIDSASDRKHRILAPVM